MRIEQAYFDRLLGETDPSEAVETISQFWGTRARAQEPDFGLAPPEYRVNLCLIYLGEIGNGGHTQYFLNRGTDRGHETARALAEVGLGTLSTILVEAMAAVSEKSMAAMTAVPSQWDVDRLARLDREAHRLLPGVDAVLLEYLRLNADDVLVPERRIAMDSSH